MARPRAARRSWASSSSAKSSRTSTTTWRSSSRRAIACPWRCAGGAWGGSAFAARPPCPAPSCLRAPAVPRLSCRRSRSRCRGGAARAQVRQSAGLLLKNNVKENYATTTDEYRRYIKVRGGPAAPACARTVTRAGARGVRATRRLPGSQRRRGRRAGTKAGVCGAAAGAAARARQPQQGAAARGRDEHRGHHGRGRPRGLAGAAGAAGAVPGEQRRACAGGRARRAVQGAARAAPPACGLQGAGAAVWPARCLVGRRCAAPAATVQSRPAAPLRGPARGAWGRRGDGVRAARRRSATRRLGSWIGR
jgi:hypothetical protein